MLRVKLDQTGEVVEMEDEDLEKVRESCPYSYVLIPHDLWRD